MSQRILTFSDVSFRYHNGSADALRDISFALERGSFTVLVGASGCGKSTLIKLAAGMAEPSSGTVEAPGRKAMVFQSGALLPWYSALDNVALALDQDRRLSKMEKEKRATDALALMNMRGLASAYPRDLSGGQRQRVGIARALVAEPELLLLDEPFSALDAETTEELHKDLMDIWRTRGITVLMISHSLDEAVALGERIFVMHQGSLVHEHRVRLDYPRDPTSDVFGTYMAEIRRELREKRKSMSR